jgi:hypothetical protein
VTDTRPSPPPLEYSNPPCSICYGDTELDGDEFDCRECECSWSVNSTDDGTWWCETNGEPSVQCPSVYQPFIHLDEKVYGPLMNATFRCYLGAEHDGTHRNPDYCGDWTDKEAVKP